jgi:hypothetical protein
VQRHQVAVHHLVAQLREPERVTAWAAADVSHQRGRRWQLPQNDLFRALELELPGRLGQPVQLKAARVMLRHRSELPVTGHDQSLRVAHLSAPHNGHDHPGSGRTVLYCTTSPGLVLPGT